MQASIEHKSPVRASSTSCDVSAVYRVCHSGKSINSPLLRSAETASFIARHDQRQQVLYPLSNAMAWRRSCPYIFPVSLRLARESGQNRSHIQLLFRAVYFGLPLLLDLPTCYTSISSSGVQTTDVRIPIVSLTSASILRTRALAICLQFQVRR